MHIKHLINERNEVMMKKETIVNAHPSAQNAHPTDLSLNGEEGKKKEAPR